MEITCYYIHDDTYSKAFAFIRENDMIYVEVAYLKHKIPGFHFKKCTFVISLNDMKQFKKLSEYYQLSQIVSRPNNVLVYSEDGDTMGFKSHIWCIPCKRNYKGICFSDNYLCNYGFATYPKNPTEIKMFNKENIEYYRNYFEPIELKSMTNDLSMYVEQEIVKISFALETIEIQTNKHKNMVDKVYELHHILPKDILIKIITILV